MLDELEKFAALDHPIAVDIKCFEAILALLLTEFASEFLFELALFEIAIPDECEGLSLGHASISKFVVFVEDWVDAFVD